MQLAYNTILCLLRLLGEANLYVFKTKFMVSRGAEGEKNKNYFFRAMRVRRELKTVGYFTSPKYNLKEAALYYFLEILVMFLFLLSAWIFGTMVLNKSHSLETR